MLRFLTLPAFAGLVHGVAFSAPQPTTVEDDLARGLTGWSPKPTSGPLELFRRDEAGPRTCGWYDDGFDTQTVTCPTGTCMLYTPSGIVGMAGCCTSTVGGIDYQNCGWVNKCYDYLDVNAGYCDDNCMTNEFIRVCTDSDMPYCQSWTYPADAVRDYGCGTDPGSTWLTVTSDVADYYDGTATAQVLFVPASATITGWNGAASGTKSGSNTKTGTASEDSASAATSASSSSSIVAKTSLPVIAIVVVAIILLLALCGAAGIITWFCIRSKRNVAKWNKPSSIALGPVSGQHTNPFSDEYRSNVVPSPGQFSGQQQPYIAPYSMPQSGTTVDFNSSRDNKTPAVSAMQPLVNPNSVSGTPAPPYSQPYMNTQPPMPQTYSSPQPYQYAQSVPHPHHGAVEAPGNPPSRPGYAELG